MHVFTGGWRGVPETRQLLPRMSGQATLGDLKCLVVAMYKTWIFNDTRTFSFLICEGVENLWTLGLMWDCVFEWCFGELSSPVCQVR